MDSSELFGAIKAASDALKRAQRQIRRAQRKLVERAERLMHEKQSLIEAGADPGAQSYYWKDNRYLYLRRVADGRLKANYIGVNPKRIQEAIDSVENGRRVREINAELLNIAERAKALKAEYETWPTIVSARLGQK